MKIIVTIPAYNAEKTLRQLYREIPHERVDELLLVDDGSSDNTVTVAHELEIPTITHKINKGYGANQKTCYTSALKKGADIVIMLHGDNQYDPHQIPALIKALQENHADIVLGSRMHDSRSARQGGMPLYKRTSNYLLTRLANVLLGVRLTDAHSGYRAYSRSLLETIPFKKNDDYGYGFDPQLLIQAVHFKKRIVEISIPTRYFPEAHTPHFWKSLHYGIKFVSLLLLYRLHKLGLTSLPFLMKD